MKKSDKIKVMSILGTRPEIIRLSCVLKKLDQYTDHILVYTGQSYSYELSQIFFKELEIKKPKYFLDVKDETLGGQIGKIISKSEKVLKKENPDAVLILGDTNSALSAIMAKRQKIPIFHMEAGNRCFDENVPEELNRKIVDHISDINLPYTENGRRYLISEGIQPGKIFVTGSPMREVLEYFKDKINASKILEKLNLAKNEYFLASIHREENVDSHDSLIKLIDSLNNLAKHYSKPIIISTHPRTEKRLKEFKIKTNSRLQLLKPFGFFDYVYLQKNAFCVLSDSGTVPEESAILRFPAVQLRNSSERPEAFDAGTIILSGLDKDNILFSVEIVTSQIIEENTRIPYDYMDSNISTKVLKLIVGLARRIKKITYIN